MDDADKTQAGSPPSGGHDDPRSRVGTILAGRYRILRLLGEGAQGSVYVGEHLRIGRKDAIKVLQPTLLKDEDAVARFRRGASKASHINHPNVCTVYDFGETEDGLPFMASEFVEGKELHDILRTDAPMELERAVDLLEQTAAGLTAAHDLNIVHRDLKPANVMLTRGR
ncbi:MAG: serine/threonine-protein kinase, partial [Gemmatimonadota bacterium]